MYPSMWGAKPADASLTFQSALISGKLKASGHRSAPGASDEGVPGPRGRSWRDTIIRGHHTRRTGILRNDLYIGSLVWNKQHYLKDPTTGKRLARPNAKELWIIEEVTHLRIIDWILGYQVRVRLRTSSTCGIFDFI